MVDDIIEIRWFKTEGELQRLICRHCLSISGDHGTAILAKYDSVRDLGHRDSWRAPGLDANPPSDYIDHPRANCTECANFGAVALPFAIEIAQHWFPRTSSGRSSFFPTRMPYHAAPHILNGDAPSKAACPRGEAVMPCAWGTYTYLRSCSFNLWRHRLVQIG